MLPKRPLTNIDLLKFVKDLNIPNFRNVYMRNNLPKRSRSKECGIINLDDENGRGTHWVAYIKVKNDVIYFDSYGNLRPPKDVLLYFKNCKIKYNYNNLQTVNSFNCGHLCLSFLYNNC